jgi:hypothetical protein
VLGIMLRTGGALVGFWQDCATDSFAVAAERIRVSM